MNSENRKSPSETDENDDQIAADTFPQTEATSRDLQRKYVSRFKLAMGIAAAFVGAADKNNEAVAQVPAGKPGVMDVAAVNNATSDETKPIMSVDSIPLTQEEIDLKVKEAKMNYSLQLKNDLQKVDTTTGSAQIMNAKLLLLKLNAEMPKAEDEYRRKALHEIRLDVATKAGNYIAALSSRRVLTPQEEITTDGFLRGEVSLLEEFTKHEANRKLLPNLNEIKAEINERKEVITALDDVLVDPKNGPQQRKIGEYFLFDMGSEKGLDYLKKSEDNVFGVLAAKPDDAVLWWEAALKESNPKRQLGMKMYALKVALQNPDAFSSAQRADFAAAYNSLATKIKAQEQLKPLAIAKAAPAKVAVPVENALANDLREARVLEPFSMMKPGKGVQFTPNGEAIFGAAVGGSAFKIPVVPVGTYAVSTKIEQMAGELFMIVLPLGNGECIVRKDHNTISLGQNDGTKPTGFEGVVKLDPNEEAKKEKQYDIGVTQNADGTYTVSVNVNGKEVLKKNFTDLPLDPQKADSWFLQSQMMGVTSFRTSLKMNLKVKVNSIKPGIVASN